MPKLDKPYIKLLKKVRHKGIPGSNRTGIMTLHTFGEMVKYDISEQVPFLTTKKVWAKGVFEELAWFIRGETNAKILEDKGVNIWKEWGPESRDMGPIYGKQWRNFGGIDQLANLVDGLWKDPYSRRHIVSSWNPPEIPEMALPPCHCFFQCFVDGTRLHMSLYQRSADMFLGVPFNIASYASLTHLIARMTGKTPGTLTHHIGDCHIYMNHLDQVDLQLTRQPRQSPKLLLHLPKYLGATPSLSLNSVQADWFEVIDYYPDPGIKGEVAI